MKKFSDEVNNKIIELFFSGLTYHKIAISLNCSDNKVRQHLIDTGHYKATKRKPKKEIIREYVILTESDIEEDIKTKIFK